MALAGVTRAGGVLERIILSWFAKLAEWTLSMIVFLGGWGLLYPGETFGYGGQLWPFLRLFGEDTWGMLMVGVGLLSFWALYVNGNRPKETSAARLFCAGARFCIWAVSAFVFIRAGLMLDRFVSSSVIYPVFLLTEMVIITRATWENKNA